MKYLEAKNLSSKNYLDYLNQLGNYSFFHTQEILEFYVESSSGKNLSFFCFEQDEVVGFVPLCIRTEKKKKIFSFNEAGCHKPLIKISLPSRAKKNYSKEIFNEIYRKILKYKIEYIDFFYHPIKFNKGQSTFVNYKNSFQILNYFDVDTVSINLNLFDLKIDKNDFENRLFPKLRQEFRKEKYNDLSFKVIDNKTLNKKLIEKNFLKYKKFHFASAGRLTRPELSWTLMLKNLFNGKASMFAIKQDEIDLSFLYCFEHKKYVFATSQTNTTDYNYLKKYNLRHYIEQKVIEFYRKNKFKYYEIGRTYFFNKNFKNFEDKHKRISIGKLKFGADLVPIHYFRFKSKNKCIFKQEYKFIVENEF